MACARCQASARARRSGVPESLLAYSFDHVLEQRPGESLRAFDARVQRTARGRQGGPPPLGLTTAAVHLANALSLLGPATDEAWHLVTGPVGTGKTTLLAAAISRWAGQGHSALYLSEAALWSAFKSSAAARGSRDYEGARAGDVLLERAKRASILLLDDWGAAQQVNPWQVDVMQGLISARYEARLLTLISTNLDPDALTMLWGHRTMDRIREMTDRGRNVWRLTGWNWRAGAPTEGRRA